MTSVHEQFPDKFILATEACEGYIPAPGNHVKLGDWNRAQSYVSDMIAGSFLSFLSLLFFSFLFLSFCLFVFFFLLLTLLSDIANYAAGWTDWNIGFSFSPPFSLPLSFLKLF